ncbi:MAG: tryptophan synthase subunit alpha [Candidatus Omnitrophica bacterium]|nr:tryptophan synthase subunit alpha [Candidatus Omnitrophota bacterium]
MERLRATFNRLRRSRRAVLIPFVMGGDPDLATTASLLLALQDAGADVIEVGIPFSDPLADGPTIQAASARALRRGATPSRVLEAIASVQAQLRVPIVCLSYWNPIMQFGSDGSPRSFLQAAHAHGVSGLIVPDVPVEEGRVLQDAAAQERIATIFLAAPTSPPNRLRAIARASQGFVYYVSVTGTTGARHALPDDLVRGIRQLKRMTTKPVCVGFGIATPAQAATVARIADGVIVGSALVQTIAAASSRDDAVQRASRFVKRLRSAVG